MSVRWIFRQLRRGDKDRQPTQGEFFATDAIRSVAEALVRESIQNSLDASLRVSGEAVRVRFHLGTIPTKTIQNYFKEGWSHFTAAGNGLDDVPSLEDFWCSFLTVEDFATTGLIGDVNQWRHEQGVKNPFYYFFRTEGRSGKGEEDRGRWGIGKYVFPRSSQINAFFALTVRSDDNRRLLMGQAVLKSHIVGSNFHTRRRLRSGRQGRLCAARRRPEASRPIFTRLRIAAQKSNRAIGRRALGRPTDR